MGGVLENLLTLGYFGVYLFSLVLNMIPFLGPSNLIIAGAIGSLFPSFNSIIVGFLIALGASTAKTIHFGISFLAGDIIKNRRKARVVDEKNKSVHYKYAMLALFIAAASPIPDDPIVIPLGLARYNPLKFFLAYFTGKATITIAGAYFGKQFGLTLDEYLGQEATIIISIILTVIITIIIMKKETIIKKLEFLKKGMPISLIFIRLNLKSKVLLPHRISFLTLRLNSSFSNV